MKDAYYFSHDSNAKDDPKCVLLIEQLGLEGYGIYWVLVEILREQPDYKYPINLLPALARRFNTTHEKIKAVVFSYELFTIENDVFFYSISLNERMHVLEEKRAKRSIAGSIGNEKRWALVAKVSQCDGKTSLSKVKESKEKESKINISFDVFWNLYDKKKGDRTKLEKKWNNLTDEERQKAIDYVPKYKLETSDKQYRKNPETFLNNKSWNDEIISKGSSNIIVPIKNDLSNHYYQAGLKEEYR